VGGTVVSTSTETGPGTGDGDQVVAQAHVFRVISAARPLAPSWRHALGDVDVVGIGRGADEPRRRVHARQRELTLCEDDTRVSAAHARLLRVPGRWLLEDLGSKNGTVVNGVRTTRAALSDGDVIELGRTFYVFRTGVPTPASAPADVIVAGDAPGPRGLQTLSPALTRDFAALRAVAASPVAVVVHGESGTGKELVALAVHALSRPAGPFVAVNCGAIPPSLAASELFGVRRGAYSDAKEDRPGLVRSADGGTLFLDEIGDLPPAVQPALLRVLQERSVTPVGQARAVAVDLRVVSASHQALDGLVARGAFREDLLARLSGFTLWLPPLRARREDLGILVAALLAKQAPAPDAVTFQPAAVRLLLGHSWPRNVRELEKHLGTALALAGDAPLGVRHFPGLPAAAAAQVAPLAVPISPADRARRDELSTLLETHDGNLSAVARAMGKDRTLVRRWIRRLALDPERFRGGK
jgi:transcriptional regulator of acetoin/glycerol metabolism